MARLTDEIVEEIHAARRQHAAHFDNDIGRIIDDLLTSQDKRVAEGWPLIKATEAPPVHRESVLQQSRFAHRTEQP